MRILVGIGLFIVAAVVTGAKAAGSLADKIVWSWQPIRLSDIRVLKEQIILRLVVTNRSSLSLPLERFVGGISRKGVQLATFRTSDIVSLPPGEQKMLQLNVKVDSETMFLALGNEIEQSGDVSLTDPLVIKGYMYINGVSVPFYEEKQIIK